MQPVIPASFNVDTTTEAFKVSNSQKDKYIRIVGGQAETISDPSQASSIEAIDQFVQKNCLNQDFSFEKQALLIQQLKTFYQALQSKDPLISNKYRKIFDKAVSEPDLQVKKTELFKFIAQTSEKIEKSDKFLQNLPAIKADYQAQKEAALKMNFDLVSLNSIISIKKIELPSQAFNLALRNASYTKEIRELSKDFEGQFALESARTRTSYAISLLNKILIEGNYPEGIQTKEEIDQLINICQNRLTTYKYAVALELVRLKKFPAKDLVVSIQQNIDSLEDPKKTNQVTTLRDNSVGFIIPGGWKGHYISYRFIKKGDDYFFEIHNKGDQVSDERLHGKIKLMDPKNYKEYRKTTVRIKTTKEALKDPKFLKTLIDAKYRRGALAYNKIYNHFLKPSNSKTPPKGTLVEGETEKQLNKLKGVNAEQVLAKALELVKKGDKYFRPCQEYGTCSESNYLTTEEDAASTSVRKSLECTTLVHQVEKLAAPLLIKKYKEKEANLTNLRKHVSNRVDKLKHVLKTLQSPSINGPEITKSQDFPSIIQQIIPKKALSKEELKKFEDKFKNGKLEFRLLPKILKDQHSIALMHIEKDPLGLKDVSPRLKDDENFVLTAVKKNGMALQHASDRLKGTLAIVLASKEQNINALAFASTSLSPIEVISALEKNNLLAKIKSKDANFNITDLPPILRDHPELVLAAIEKNGMDLQHASDRLKKDPMIVRASKNNIRALEFAGDNLTLDQVYTKAEKLNLLKDIEKGNIRIQSKITGKLLPKIFLEDRDVILAAVRFDGLTLRDLPPKYQEDIEIVKTSKQQNFMALNYASEKIKLNDILTPKEKQNFIDSLKNGKVSLGSLPKLLKNDPDIVLAAVQKNGLALQFASEKLQGDPKIVLEAKKQNIKSLDYASEQLKVEDVLTIEEKIKMKDSLRNGTLTLDAVPKLCRNNKDMVLAAIEKDPLSLKYASHALRSNYYVCNDAVQKNGMALEYVLKSTEAYSTIASYALQQNGLALQHLDLGEKRGYFAFGYLIEQAAKQNIHALQFGYKESYAMKEDLEFISNCLKRDIKAIKYFPNISERVLLGITELVSKGIIDKKISLKDLPTALRNNLDIVLKAVQNNGLDLEHASKAMQSNEDVVLAAIKQNIQALNYVSENLSCQKILLEKPNILKALVDGKIKFQSLPKELKEDKEIVLAALKKDTSFFQSLPEKFRGDVDIVLEGMKQDITTLNFIHKDSFKNKALPQNKLLYNLVLLAKNPIIKALKEGKLNLQSLPIFNEEIAMEAMKHDSANIKNVLKFLLEEPLFATQDQHKAFVKKVLDFFITQTNMGLDSLENQIDSFVLSEKFAFSDINKLIKDKLLNSFKDNPQIVVKAWADQSSSVESTPLQEMLFEFLSYRSPETYLKTIPTSLQKQFFDKCKELAKNTSPLAQLNLAFCYQHGFGIEVDKKKSFEIARQTAETGNNQAQIILANDYREGSGVVKHEKSAFNIYKRLADKGDSGAQYHLGMCYKKGVGVEPNLVASNNSMEQSAMQGNSYALFQLGLSNQEGSGVVKNLKKAFECFENASVYGNPNHQLHLALCYLNGSGVQQDPKKAFDLIQKSADQNDPFAQNFLATCYEKGIGVKEDKEKASEMYLRSARNFNTYKPKDLPLIIKIIQDAVRLGIAEAKVDLGIMYEEGLIDNKIDTKEAIKLYTEASAQGNKNANKQLGRVYEFGIGVQKDIKKAIEYYMQGGELSAEIVNRIAGYYDKGIGVEVDKVKAYNFYLMAGNHGDVASLYNAGCCLYNGTGVKQDLDEAIKLWSNPILKDSGAALLGLAWIYDARNELQKAGEYFLKAGDIFDAGNRNTAKDLDRAIECYESGSDCGNAEAKIKLALLYEKKALTDNTIDLERVFELYSEAAKAPEITGIQAIENVARCYENGIGTEKNLTKAIEAYSEAAKKYEKLIGEDNKIKALQLKQKVASLINI